MRSTARWASTTADDSIWPSARRNRRALWARRYLIGKNFSFFAFRTAVPGMATGAHIHIGPGSAHRAPQKASVKPQS